MNDDTPITNPDDKPPTSTEKTKRPTTRGGRKAQADANRAARAAAGGDTPPAPAAKLKATPKPRKASLEKRLQASVAMIGVGVQVVGSRTSPAVAADGVAIIGESANLAKALSDVADNDPRVRVALERMLAVSTYGALLAAFMPLMMQIGVNHQVIDPNMVAMLGGMAGDDDTDPPADPVTGI